jgi:hypothetical protein
MEKPKVEMSVEEEEQWYGSRFDYFNKTIGELLEYN